MKKKVATSPDDNELVTKGFLKKELHVGFTMAAFDTDQKLKAMEERIEEKHRDYRDEVLTKLDYIVRKIDKMDQEMTIGFYHIDEQRTDLADHEKRLKKLEFRWRKNR